MKQNFELRNAAWNTLSGNWGNSVLIYFLISLVSGIISGTVAVLLPELSSIANFAPQRQRRNCWDTMQTAKSRH